jgi:hypothetical protein
MSIMTLAVVNGLLAIALLAALGLVCSLPFRLAKSPGPRLASLLSTGAERRNEHRGEQRLAA